MKTTKPSIHTSLLTSNKPFESENNLPKVLKYQNPFLMNSGTKTLEISTKWNENDMGYDLDDLCNDSTQVSRNFTKDSS
jgi:hypothetical protein